MVTVKVSDLLKMAKELDQDQIEYVDIEEYEADGNPEDEYFLPKRLHFEGYDGFGGGIDYEDIEHIEVSCDYKFEKGLKP